MRTRITGSTAGLALMAAALLCVQSGVIRAQAPAAGQAAPGAGARGAGGARGAAPAAPAGPVPRNAEGKPDMAGAWTGSFNLGLQNIQTSRGVIVEPADGRIPYKPEWAALNKETASNNMFAEPELHCYLSGVPHIMYIQFGFQIIPTPANMVFAWDFMGAYRNVYMDGRPHIHPDIKLFMGDSLGKWEGDTLVVDTTNQNGITWFDTAGTFHSNQIHVVERFTMTDANTIRYEATVEDPVAFTAPMKLSETFRRNASTNWEVMEYACIEGNKDNLHYPESAGGPKKNAPIAAPDEFITQRGGRGAAPAAPAGAAPRGGAAPAAPPAGAPPRGQQ